MLSISARQATSGIRAYLEGEQDGAHRGPDDYYSDGGLTTARWLGSGAHELSLSGNVNELAFDRIVAGFHPETNEPLVQRAGEAHRPGWDLTFSAPKSVSVIWGLAKAAYREEIEVAHGRAVERSFQLAEQQQLFVTRRGKDGVEREAVQPIIAAYQHGTSREADPQLHTHAFLMNIGLRGDGEFGTLESKPLYQWKMALGAAYRAELADELRRMGYEVEPDRKGTFRLAAVPRELEQQFSKRRAQIEAVLNERGDSSAKSAEIAALNTRKEKEVSDVQTLRAGWHAEAKELGITAEHLATWRTDRAIEMRALTPQDTIERLHNEHSTFTVMDVARAAAEKVQYAGGGLTRVQEQMHAVVNHEDVVSLTETRYATRQMIAMEQEALQRAERLATASHFGVDASVLAKKVDARSWSDEQRIALTHLTTASRLSVMEGLAGTGKSYLLGAAREAWEESGYEVRGAALAGKAAKGLQDSSGIRAQTLHSLLNDLVRGQDRLTEHTVLVIDESGMVGSRQLARVMEEAERAQAKVVLVGDANQLQPIEAGQLFERIGQAVGAARLTDIQRQRDAADRAMVQALAQGDTHTALASLTTRGRIHAASDRAHTMQQLVRDWDLARDSAQPRDDVMLAATRADAMQLNTLARAQLREHGELKHEREVATTNGPLTLAEGDRIVITRNAKMLAMMNGDLGTVTALAERRGELEVTAKLDDASTRTWRVSDHPHFEYGYALTTHKAQGVSVERAFVLIHESMSAKEWSYVAGSRAREAVHLYTEQRTADDLERIMGRSHKKDTTLDYVQPTIIHEAALER